jgi:hypothetical protein
MMKPTKTKPVRTKEAAPAIEEIADLRGKGVSLAQIARMRGVSRQAIAQTIKRHGIDAGEIESFRKARPAVLAAKQRLLLDGITTETVKKMSGRDKLVGFGILYDKERLELGESTMNISNLHSIAERAIKAVSTRGDHWHSAEEGSIPPQLPAGEVFADLKVIEKQREENGDGVE